MITCMSYEKERRKTCSFTNVVDSSALKPQSRLCRQVSRALFSPGEIKGSPDRNIMRLSLVQCRNNTSKEERNEVSQP